MKKIFIFQAFALPMLAIILIVGFPTPSMAFIMALAETAKTAKDEAYQKFMMLKAIQQLKALRDNYEASMRYYAMYKRLNEGKGILPNVARRIGDVGIETAKDAQSQFKSDWIYDQGYGSNIDQLINKMDDYTSGRIRYAGKAFEKSLEAHDEGEKIALEAGTLDTKSTQTMILKTEALQLQMTSQTNAMMAQLLDVNTRAYQLQLEEKQARLRDWDIFDKSIDTLKKSEQSGARKRGLK